MAGDSPEQSRQLTYLEERIMVNWLRRLGNDIKICYWVHITSPSAMAKRKIWLRQVHTSRAETSPPSGLNSPNELTHVTTRNIRARKIAQTRQHVLLKVLVGSPCTALLTFRQLFTSELTPASSNRFKRVVGGVRGFLALGATM
jgi:hypothetical protein